MRVRRKKNIGCESSEFGFTYVIVEARNGQLSHTQLLTASSYECESSEFGFTYVRVEITTSGVARVIVVVVDCVWGF